MESPPVAYAQAVSITALQLVHIVVDGIRGGCNLGNYALDTFSDLPLCGARKILVLHLMIEKNIRIRLYHKHYQIYICFWLNSLESSAKIDVCGHRGSPCASKSIGKSSVSPSAKSPPILS